MEEDPNVMRRGRAVGYTPAAKSYALSGKIMLSAIVILFTAVLFILLLHIYARCCLRRGRSSRPRRRLSSRFLHNPTPSSAGGLDAAVLRSLPVFVFSSSSSSGDGATHHRDALECAVCLSEFEDGEMGRLLPKCNHKFHIDCIDMWFHSHSACPLCRSDAKPDSPKPKPKPNPNPALVLENRGEIAIEVEGNGDSEVGFLSSAGEETGPSSSSSSSSNSGVCSSSSALRKKALGFVGLGVEVPTREVDIAVASPGGQGMKSPRGRILALKRMLSRDRRVETETTDLERGEEQPNQNH